MTLKQRLRGRQRPVCGLMVTSLASADLIEACAQAGLDFLIFDHEHFPSSEPALTAHCEVAALCGISPLVRIPAPDPVYASRALDMGAEGIMVPRCRTWDEVQAVLAGCYYPPLGERSFSSRSAGQRLHRVRATGGGKGSRADLLESQNQQTVVIVQVETGSLLRELAGGIPADPRVDALFIGAADLAVSLGEPDRTWDAAGLRQLLPPVSAGGGGPALGAVASRGSVTAWMAEGFTCLLVGHDTAVFAAGLRQHLQADS